MVNVVASICIIGLGRMGSGMCNNLTRRGYRVYGFDINKAAYSRCQSPLFTPADSPASCASSADVVILSLPTGVEVSDTLSKLPVGLRPLIIDTTTLGMDELAQILGIVKERNLRYLTCRLERGPKEANEGKLALFCGGYKGDYDSVIGLLNDLGEPIFVGDHAQATMLKLISNMIGTTIVVLNAEIASVIRAAGIDPEVAVKALSMGGANNAQLFRLLWQVKKSHEESFSLELAQHVVQMGIESSKRYFKIKSLPLTELANIIMVTAKSMGFGAKDVSEVSKLLDIINGQ